MDREDLSCSLKLDSSDDSGVMSVESLKERDGAWVAILARENALRANGELVGGNGNAAKVRVEILWIENKE